MSRHRTGRKSSKKQIELMLLPDERCVLVRRGKRVYQLKVSLDGSRLYVVGEPPKKMAKRMEKHLTAMTEILAVQKKFLRECIAWWAREVGVFQMAEFDIPK